MKARIVSNQISYVLPSNAMFMIPPDLIGGISAKHQVPYTDYMKIVEKFRKFSGKPIPALNENEYLAYRTQGVIGAVAFGERYLVYLTGKQFVQFCAYVHEYSLCRDSWITDQLIDFILRTNPVVVKPYMQDMVYPDKAL